MRSAAPLGPFSALVIANRGKMVEYCFLSLEHTLRRAAQSPLDYKLLFAEGCLR